MDYHLLSIAPIMLLPLLAFAINVFIVKRFTTIAVALSCFAIIGSFFFSFRIFGDFLSTYSSGYYIHKVFNWFDLSYGTSIFKVDMGIYIDNMTSVMLLMVTGVASLIHIFSTYYMHDDARYGRFFVYLSLFTSAMLGLVLSDNLLSVFIFWELMGFCSYSLIGFYYEKEEAGNASLKAFMTTRVGDVFFLLGILATWSVVGNVTFVDIYSAIASGAFANQFVLGLPLVTFIGICIFLGTVGKSAQFPLQIWLPDAMMGPTPCSALIHAATMVAAGVYLSLRIFPILEVGGLLTMVSYIGAITAFGAATIALIQTDIKAVLAFSTISQLGYMVLGIGVGAYNPAFMHLVTHAVFKACLFLAAGSVIHSLHVQEMPRMGGLRKKLPFTFLAMLLCTFAIAGFPFFSGFVSKDRILGDALVAASHNAVLWPVVILGFSAALLTAFYMFRMMFLTFFGTPRDQDLYDHAHTEHLKWNQNIPLLILAVFTLGLFYSGSLTGQKIVKVFPIDKGLEWFETLITEPKPELFKNYKSEPLTIGSSATSLVDKSLFPQTSYDPSHGLSEDEAHHVHHMHMIGAILSIIIAFAGCFLAYLMYISKTYNPGWWVNNFSGWVKALKNRYYFDDLYIKGFIGKMMLPMNRALAQFDLGIYDRYIVDGQAAVARFFYRCSNWFDMWVVDRAGVDGTALSVRVMNVILRSIQTGKIQYSILILIIVLAVFIQMFI